MLSFLFSFLLFGGICYIVFRILHKCNRYTVDALYFAHLRKLLCFVLFFFIYGFVRIDVRIVQQSVKVA